jgi:hypothetical protein
MRYFLVLVIINFLSFYANAVIVEVRGKLGAPLFLSEANYKIPSNVGEISVQALDKGKVPYTGGSFGLAKIFDLGNDIVVISKTEMKAYGWCFDIDGLVPETMADETLVVDQNSKIIWYYAYAHYKDGNWIGQCVKGQ